MRAQHTQDFLTLHDAAPSPPARAQQQAVQRAQVSGDARWQGADLLPDVVKAAVQGVIEQVYSRQGRVQQPRLPSLPLPVARHHVHPAGLLRQLQGVLQAVQVALRQHVGSAGAPYVIQLPGVRPIRAPPSTASGCRPTAFYEGAPATASGTGFLAGRDDVTVLLCQL